MVLSHTVLRKKSPAGSTLVFLGPESKVNISPEWLRTPLQLGTSRPNMQ
jgi:hypothetical protein